MTMARAARMKIFDFFIDCVRFTLLQNMSQKGRERGWTQICGGPRRERREGVPEDGAPMQRSQRHKESAATPDKRESSGDAGKTEIIRGNRRREAGRGREVSREGLSAFWSCVLNSHSCPLLPWELHPALDSESSS